MTRTPGPWRIEPAVPGEASGVHVFAGCATDGDLVTIADFIENEANARLIAAAPDLLDALRAFCGDYECTPLQIPEIQAAYRHALTVIAKAEGRA